MILHGRKHFPSGQSPLRSGLVWISIPRSKPVPPFWRQLSIKLNHDDDGDDDDDGGSGGGGGDGDDDDGGGGDDDSNNNSLDYSDHDITILIIIMTVLFSKNNHHSSRFNNHNNNDHNNYIMHIELSIFYVRGCGANLTWGVVKEWGWLLLGLKDWRPPPFVFLLSAWLAAACNRLQQTDKFLSHPRRVSTFSGQSSGRGCHSKPAAGKRMGGFLSSCQSRFRISLETRKCWFLGKRFSAMHDHAHCS